MSEEPSPEPMCYALTIPLEEKSLDYGCRVVCSTNVTEPADLLPFQDTTIYTTASRSTLLQYACCYKDFKCEK